MSVLGCLSLFVCSSLALAYTNALLQKSNGAQLAFASCWRVVLFIGHHMLSGAGDTLGKIRIGEKVANRM